jgi:uncharacterized protein YyaL (SSP411 family)
LEAANAVLTASLSRLRETRAKRPRPHLDDKIITAWNGLMISALAKAAQVFGAADDADRAEAERYLQAATRAAEFIGRELYDETTGTLYRAYRHGRANIQGFAEDYAFVIQALLDVYEASFDVRWLRWADRLQERMDELFWDDAAGGYFSSPQGDASILLRLKEDHDGAEPAASSVGALNLLRLSAISEPRAARAMRTLDSLRPQWSKIPHALPQALCALEYALIARRQVVIAGDPASVDFQALWGEGQRWLAERAPWLAEMRPAEGRATAYVCEHYTCREPVHTPEQLRQQLT